MYASAINPADTLTKRAAIQTGQIQPVPEREEEKDRRTPHDIVPPDLNHSKKFGEMVAKHLSGRGLQHDHIEVANHVIQALKKGGHLKRDLLHAYVHGKVPAKRKRFRHKKVATHHSRDEPFSGGDVGHIHSVGGILQSRDFEPPTHVHVI